MNEAAGWLFTRGHAADIVLLVLLAEALLLVRAGRAPGSAFVAVAPGALMMVSLRGALTAQWWPWIALPLALSGPAHLADLRRRGWLG